jgi:hypothetical protein
MAVLASSRVRARRALEADAARFTKCSSDLCAIIDSPMCVVDATSLASALDVSRRRLYAMWADTSLGGTFETPRVLVDWMRLINIGAARQLSASWEEVADGTALGPRTLWRLFRRYPAKLNGYFAAE